MFLAGSFNWRILASEDLEKLPSLSKTLKEVLSLTIPNSFVYAVDSSLLNPKKLVTASIKA